MSNKCKWKDGKFVACDGFDPCTYNEGKVGTNIAFCAGCDSDITKRKPEPEVIIKKSGCTWVARYDGVDWLYIGDETEYEPFFPTKDGYAMFWKPFSDIEITDEIAKLRPIVVWYDDIMKLISVEEKGCCSIIDNCGTVDVVLDNIRLATVGDLS